MARLDSRAPKACAFADRFIQHQFRCGNMYVNPLAAALDAGFVHLVERMLDSSEMAAWLETPVVLKCAVCCAAAAAREDALALLLPRVESRQLAEDLLITGSYDGLATVLLSLLARWDFDADLLEDALDAACAGDHAICAGLILGIEGITGEMVCKALVKTSRVGQLGCLAMLLADPRCDPSYGRNQSIHEAAAHNHVAVIELLLADPRVDPGDRESDAFRVACWAGHFKAVQLLLTDGRINPAAVHRATWRRRRTAILAWLTAKELAAA